MYLSPDQTYTWHTRIPICGFRGWGWVGPMAHKI